MVFSSLSFLFFLLPLFLVVDTACIRSTGLRNAALILFSLLFYTWGEAGNVLLLILLGCVNYGAGALVWRSRGLAGKTLLGVFVGLNIGCLVYYKYLFWIASQLMSVFPSLLQLELAPKALPLGISFFTFHGISYLVDLHRRRIVEPPTALNFLTYFFMFPHLVAGPIVRYAQVEEDLRTRRPNWSLFVYGVARLLVGINKKILIANSVAPMADAAFSLPASHLGLWDAWLGALAYTVQIYFDFSGYSDMAIGLAAMAGFHFEENFLAPYRSKSIREFWRRWHISLSSWFRDYLYIPLGGSKASLRATYRNLFLVFVVCGLWHGAQFTFLVWGVLHGALLVAERLGLGDWLERRPVAAGRVYCMLMVTLGWVFFRASDVGQAWHYVQTMFHVTGLLRTEVIIPVGPLNLIALVLGLLIALFPLRLFASNTARTPQYSSIAYAFNVVLGVVSLAVLYIGSRNPFIYFNF